MTIVPIPAPTPEQALGWLNVLKQIRGFFKKKDKSGSVIETKGIDYELAKKDLPEILIIEVDGAQYLVHKDSTPPILFEYIKRQKADQLKNKTIDLIRNDYIREVKETKEVYDRGLEQVPQNLNEEYSALLIMSRNIKSFFDNGDIIRGRALKSNLGLIYGSTGNLFCNLYSQGYLIRALEHFDQLVKYGQMPPEKINQFLKVCISNWDSVFFVHPYTTKEELYEKIKLAFSMGKEYIAIHGISNINVDRINEIYSSIVSDHIVDSVKYKTKISEGSIKRGDSIYPIKDVYFFTERGKLIYEEFQLKSICPP